MHNNDFAFIVEHNVGKMAKWLRMVGFDAKLFTGADDNAIIAIALTEKRILLTRDRRIMKRRVIVNGSIQAILIESDNFKDQVRQIQSELKLDKNSFRPFTICLECNGRLEGKVKEAVLDRVPPYVYFTQKYFSECPVCHRIYWQGTHWQAMKRAIDDMPVFEHFQTKQP